MAIQAIAGAAKVGVASPSASPGKEKFAQLMRVGSKPPGERPSLRVPSSGGAPQAVRASPGVSRARADKASVLGPITSQKAARVIDQVSRAQLQLDHVLKLAESGRTFTPAALLSLQAQVAQATQKLDLAGKVVEKATSGVKQLLTTQV